MVFPGHLNLFLTNYKFTADCRLILVEHYLYVLFLTDSTVFAANRSKIKIQFTDLLKKSLMTSPIRH